MLVNSKQAKFSSKTSEQGDKKRYVSPTELADIYCGFIENYPIVSVEDPFDQDDWEGYVIISFE